LTTNNADYWIKALQLEPHPEGGYFRETYRSEETIDLQSLDKYKQGRRNLSTGIYFLLEKGSYSAFHRIQSDEMWHFYDGDPLIIHMIDRAGNYSFQVLGRAIEKGEALQFVVPAGVWFASEVAREGAYSLVGCTVSFGFDFQDFELADRKLMEEFPQHENIISRLLV
jgi:predicted cupin superfamily sugar epimerase